jgi:hypothetical protein
MEASHPTGNACPEQFAPYSGVLHREHPKKYCKFIVFIPLLLFTQFAIFDSIHSITMAAVFEAEERISSVTIEGVVRPYSSLFLFLC